MTGTTHPSPVLVDDARDLARELLGEATERWAHSAGVALAARRLAVTIGNDDPSVLVAAAWLHDIGYAPAVVDTGFHPLDGAAYLARHGFTPRVVWLVAHHSGARYVAAGLDRSRALRRYAWEESPLADALTYADQTVGPGGRRMSVEERVADMLDRHGPDSPNARAHHLRGPYLLAAAARVRRRLATVGE
jgi:hypothetical protein